MRVDATSDGELDSDEKLNHEIIPFREVLEMYSISTPTITTAAPARRSVTTDQAISRQILATPSLPSDLGFGTDVFRTCRPDGHGTQRYSNTGACLSSLLTMTMTKNIDGNLSSPAEAPDSSGWS